MATYQNKIPPILPPKRAVQILQNYHVQNLQTHLARTLLRHLGSASSSPFGNTPVNAASAQLPASAD